MTALVVFTVVALLVAGPDLATAVGVFLRPRAVSLVAIVSAAHGALLVAYALRQGGV